MPLVTNVYIDGFNFYYRCVKGTPYKWLDISKWATGLLAPDFTIKRIRYYTARVRSLPGNPDAPLRQAMLLRALATIPNLTITYGHFLRSKPRLRLANPPPGGPDTVQVVKYSEKGSDVNLATDLLADAFDGDCEAVAIVSSDSDLLGPIKLVRQRFGSRIVIVRLPRGHSIELEKEADYVIKVHSGLLQASQFPPALKDAVGAFTKPAAW